MMRQSGGALRPAAFFKEMKSWLNMATATS
nr:MAG TPA: hypothetical protein [Caudoviricetes sp.]